MNTLRRKPSDRTKGARRVSSPRIPSVSLPRHPDGLPWPHSASSTDRPIAIDLFSGAGGLSRGLEDAGFHVALAVDHDSRSVETHLHNFTGDALQMDLADKGKINELITLTQGIPVDLIAGGPPCQPFSPAGQSKIRHLIEHNLRDTEDPRAELWEAIVCLAESILPKAVLIENVPGLTLANNGQTLKKISTRLEEVGYEVVYGVVDASFHGIPQPRQRLIIIGMKDGSFVWPETSDEDRNITVWDAIGDLPKLENTTGKVILDYDGPQTSFQKHMRRDMTTKESSLIYDHITRPVRDDDLDAFMLIHSGTRYSQLPEHLKRYRDDIFNDKYNRLHKDKLSRTITAHIAKDGYWYIHPTEHRTISIREAARIQTFPDNFRFSGARTNAYRQIGNAVPPELAYRIGTSILNGFNETSNRAAVSKWTEDINNALRQISEKNSFSSDSPEKPWHTLAEITLNSREDGAVTSFLNRFPTVNLAADKRYKLGLENLSVETRLNCASLRVAARIIKETGWFSYKWASTVKLDGIALERFKAIALGELNARLGNAELRVLKRLIGISQETHIKTIHVRVIINAFSKYDEDVSHSYSGLNYLSKVYCHISTPSCSECPISLYCATSDSSRKIADTMIPSGSHSIIGRE